MLLEILKNVGAFSDSESFYKEFFLISFQNFIVNEVLMIKRDLLGAVCL